MTGQPSNNERRHKKRTHFYYEIKYFTKISEKRAKTRKLNLKLIG
jgi:hypothetical protein